MRVFFYTVLGFPLLAADGVLIASFPAGALFSSRRELWIVAAGAAAYLLVHFFVRKPERLYVWGHEFSHLVAAKVFLRKVHGFHITARDGGRVVIDRTNVAIDLAPYAVPFYAVVAAALASLLRTTSRWVPDVGLAAVSFFVTMHVVFSCEGFLAGQPDVRRSGRIFSAGAAILALLLLVPCLLASGTVSGWDALPRAYRAWAAGSADAARTLLAACRGLLNL